jgi:ABC-2 type transport system permease protein
MYQSLADIARFARLSTYAYRALLAWLTPRDYLLFKVVEPTSQIIFFALLGAFAGQDKGYFVLGNAVRIASLSALVGCCLNMVEERYSGTLMAVTAAATPVAQTFLARNMWQGVDGVVSILIGLGAGALLFGLDFSMVHWPWLIFALLITSYAMTGLGLLLSTCGLFVTNLDFIMNAGYGVLMVLCGVNYPVAELPALLRGVAYGLPLTHGLAAVRAIFLGDLAPVPMLLLREAGIGLAYSVVAYLIFRWAEYQARVQGQLDLM